MKKALFMILVLGLLLGTVGIQSPAAAPKVVLVEAESFQDLGGWGLDQQFMDQMGSPYLLAHGLGTPVQDAVTEVKIEQAGSYKLWVRTMDWVARWNAPGAPGKFQVTINGKAAPATFGTEGAKWHWQDGGMVELPAGALKLALHDLTGFEGRCDAILFSADPAFIPPNELDTMDAFRRQALGIPAQPENAGAYDLVVVGGGLPGVCAAVNAARLGLKVALINDRAVLGGNASSEIHVGPAGNTKFEPYPHIGDVVAELCPPWHRSGMLDGTKLTTVRPTGDRRRIDLDQLRLDVVKGEKNIALFAEYHVNKVEAADKKVQTVEAEHTRTAKRIRLAGRFFADCTGDGTVGALAGADYDVTLKQHMGPSNIWDTIDTGAPAPFPRCPWALPLNDKPFPGRAKYHPKTGYAPGLASLGRWYWESGADWDPITQVEDMRDWNLRAMYGAWDALKNEDGLYPNHKLRWAGYLAGKRESRRLLGDVILDSSEFMESKKYEDGCYPCTWSVDLHYPKDVYTKDFEGNAFITYCTHDRYPSPYWAPYRTLYSRNIGNLFMAGRDISVTHNGMGPTRVMRTGGMMGEIVGMAAAICVKNDTTPRGVYEKHLADLKALMASGVPKRIVPDVTQAK